MSLFKDVLSYFLVLIHVAECILPFCLINCCKYCVCNCKLTFYVFISLLLEPTLIPDCDIQV